jgi:hypothetical protein
MSEYKKPAWMKRFRTSSAYIDSFVVAIYIIAAACLAGWIAYETRGVINPWWLGGSVTVIFVYLLIIAWLLGQFHDVDRIFFTYMTGVLCLGMILALVVYISGVQLPTDLPVLSFLAYLAGMQVESFDPGAVAISYAVVVGFGAVIVACPFLFLDNTKPVRFLVKKLKLDHLDYFIDSSLDYLGYRLDTGRNGWLMVLFGLVALVCLVVVGGAALI